MRAITLVGLPRKIERRKITTYPSDLKLAIIHIIFFIFLNVSNYKKFIISSKNYKIVIITKFRKIIMQTLFTYNRRRVLKCNYLQAIFKGKADRVSFRLGHSFIMWRDSPILSSESQALGSWSRIWKSSRCTEKAPPHRSECSRIVD